jgi:hypothetical protein
MEHARFEIAEPGAGRVGSAWKAKARGSARQPIVQPHQAWAGG